MTTVDRRVKARWPEVPNVRVCLYAAELSNGMVKFGCTRTPRERLLRLEWNCLQEFGAKVLSFHCGPVLAELDRYPAERRLLALAGAHGERVTGRREFYRIQIEAARALLSESAKKAKPSPRKERPALDHCKEEKAS